MANMNNQDLKRERLQLKTRTRQDSQYARSLIEASLDPLVTISGKGKIMDMNAALASVTGMSREELTERRSIQDWVVRPALTSVGG